MAPHPKKDNKLAIVVISASLAVIAVVALLALLRRDPAPAPRPDPGQPASNRVIAEPQPRRDPSLPVTVPEPVPPPTASTWIVGRWAMSNEPCTGVIYEPDGTWQIRDAGGYWRIEGSSLINVTVYQMRGGRRVPVNRPPARFEALSIGPNEIQLRFPRGGVNTLRRC